MKNSILASLASAALVVSPIAAQAAAPRTASSVSEEENIAGIGTWGLILGLAIIAGVIILIADDNNDPASP